MLHWKPIHRQAAFFIFLFGALFPLLFFPVFSRIYHNATRFPQISNATLNLEQYDLSQGTAIPLDGKWEFFNGTWIITDPQPNRQPDLLASVPLPWQWFPEMKLSHKGTGSYHITLENCPANQKLVVFIPNINTRYRVYLNGVPVAARGSMELEGDQAPRLASPMLYNPILAGVTAPPDGRLELVVEVSSAHIGGLYQTPMLMEETAFHVRYDSRNMAAASIISVTFVAIACFVVLLILGDKLFSSYALLLLDTLAFLRILFQSNYFEVIKRTLALHDYVVNTLFQVIALFLPVVFLLCMRQMLQFKIENKKLVTFACFDLSIVPFILWAAAEGRPRVMLALYLIGCAPFLFVFIGLYDRIKHGAPYALEISATLMAVVASVIGTSLASSGILILDVSLYPPTCFMVAMLLQLWIFLRRSIQVQRQAVEAENLRLRLLQSRSDLMMSQIKPHFLYNSLIAIHTLCTEAPETAAEATLKFATFLRTNMNMIGQQELIPFEKELAHIRNYAEIELLRHRKRLTVRYEIAVTDFMVPPLSIQPIVENAIRHGACKNITGGEVVVKTDQTETHFEVEITDDGPGFDPSALSEPSEEPHGLQNILFRLQNQGAQVKIESNRDHGTRVLVLIAKGEER